MAGKRILIVEQQNDMAKMMAARLAKASYQVDVAPDAAEGLRLARATRPDLLVLDATVVKPTSREMLNSVRSHRSTADIPVLLLTPAGKTSQPPAGVWIGADEYVSKPFSMSALVERVSTMLRRSRADQRAGGVLTVGPIRINTETYRAEVNGRSVGLTLTEFRLLVAIVSAGGRVLTRQELIAEAIGEDAIVTSRTIDVHLAAVRRKLGKARGYLETVRGVGYRLGLEENAAD